MAKNKKIKKEENPSSNINNSSIFIGYDTQYKTLYADKSDGSKATENVFIGYNHGIVTTDFPVNNDDHDFITKISSEEVIEEINEEIKTMEEVILEKKPRSLDSLTKEEFRHYQRTGIIPE